MNKKVYKAPNGKLLRVSFDLEGETIKQIRICGDFFVHPEPAIEKIEEFLSGRKIGSLEDDLNEFLNKKNIRIIGFTAADLKNILSGKQV